MTTRLPQNLTEMPDLPREFGDDGGHFYSHYDKWAEESDENLIKNLKAQLDSILIFAGLFAGVNSTFLTFTLPQLSANPVDDTNALLLHIALNGNSSITSAADLPSASFMPPPRIYLVNVLLSVSLMLALFSSLLAVLGQQWIVYYNKRGSGGAEDQRWERLRRYLGAKRWGLELVLDDLVPGLLQLGLVIFCSAFTLYLGTSSRSLNRIIVWLFASAAATILGMATGSAFDPWCPFKQPLSRIARPVAAAILTIIPWLVGCGYMLVCITAGHIINAIWRATLYCRPPNVRKQLRQRIFTFRSPFDIVKAGITMFADIYRWFMFAGVRPAMIPGDLEIEALRRVILTCEDRNVLVYAAINLQAIRNERVLSSLGNDVEFCARMANLQQAALRDTQHRRAGGEYSSIESRVFSTSFLHVIFFTCSKPLFLFPGGRFAVSGTMVMSFDRVGDLYQGSIIPLEKNCDQCSFCASLLFSITIVHIVVEYIKSRQQARIGSQMRIDSQMSIAAAFEGIVGASTGTHDLRLGFLTATVMVVSKQQSNAIPSVVEWRCLNILQGLFAAYRETSELVMFQTISKALITVNAQWIWKPNHGIYIWLFELCLLPGWKEMSKVEQNAILKRVDDHLISTESWIRDENTPEIDRQLGRDYQNRYVQSVAAFFRAHMASSRKMWTLIGPPLERYIKSVKILMETDLGHPENPRTMDLLRRIKSAFPEPQLVGAFALDADGEQEQDSQHAAYLGCRRLLDELAELS